MTQFDKLSDMRIPFAVASWSRDHKFHQSVVTMSRSLSRLKEMEADKVRIEEEILSEERRLKRYIAAVSEVAGIKNGV